MNSFFKNFGLFLSGLVASALVLSPTYRNRILHFMDSDDTRHVLATLTLKTDDSQFKIVKIRKNKHILIEVYTVKDTEQFTLLSTFEIPYSRDVFYDLKTSMSNMFATNIDDDTVDEVIVPVMDENLVAHLNVIKFDPKTKNFEHYAFD